MKRTKALALTLAAATMMMGAGYAYWTDTLTINNTVSTGEFNVNFTEATLTSQEYVGVTPVTRQENSVVFEADKLYPGATLNFDAVFKNEGTIPAVIDSVVLNASGTADRSRFLVTGSITAPGYGSINIPTGTTLAVLENVVTSQAKGIRLEPQATVTLDLNIQLDPTLTGDQQENVSLSELFTINFKQHNAQ